MDVREHNRIAWNRKAELGDRFALPVDSAAIERSRAGLAEIYPTPLKPAPHEREGQRDERAS